MQTVTFAREYRHKLDGLREAVYPPNVEIEITNEVAEAARKAGALKEEGDGERSAQGNGTGDNHHAKGKRAPARNRSKGAD